MKKFKTHNDGIDWKVSIGTGLLDYLTIPYDIIVKTFGEPGESDGYKVDAEWEIEFEDGNVATIYNYKSGKNYLGEKGIPTKDIKEWHIGGRKRSVVKDVIDILNDTLEKEGI